MMATVFRSAARGGHACAGPLARRAWLAGSAGLRHTRGDFGRAMHVPRSTLRSRGATTQHHGAGVGTKTNGAAQQTVQTATQRASSSGGASVAHGAAAPWMLPTLLMLPRTPNAVWLRACYGMAGRSAAMRGRVQRCQDLGRKVTAAARQRAVTRWQRLLSQRAGGGMWRRSGGQVVPVEASGARLMPWSRMAMFLRPRRGLTTSASRRSAPKDVGKGKTAAGSPKQGTSASPAAGGAEGATVEVAVGQLTVWQRLTWPFARAKAFWTDHSTRLKRVFRTYGVVALGTYFGTYFITLGTLFVLVHNKLIKGPDVTKWLNSFSVVKSLTGGKPIHLPVLLEEYLIAWLIAKTTEPARVMGTVIAVPAIVRWLPVPWLRLLRVRVPFKRRREYLLSLPASKRLSRRTPVAARRVEVHQAATAVVDASTAATTATTAARAGAARAAAPGTPVVGTTGTAATATRSVEAAEAAANAAGRGTAGTSPSARA